MKYIFDSGPFIVMTNYYPSTFRTLWAELDEMAACGELESVQEVSNELLSYNRSTFVQEWVKQHKRNFSKPSNDELLVVQQILAVPHFQVLIGQEALLRGKPVADPFVIAAGKVRGATVVTEERPKPNAAKVPNVCDRFGVPWMSFEDFMKLQKWAF